MNNKIKKNKASDNKAKMTFVMSELAKGNRIPFGEIMADDFCWKMMGTTPWSGTYQGKKAVGKDLMKPLFDKFADEYTNTAHRFIAEGDFVVVECEGKVNTKSGKPYNNTYCYVCKFADGKLVELTEYMDTQLVVDVLGKRE
jgi:uncharacterized protein